MQPSITIHHTVIKGKICILIYAHIFIRGRDKTTHPLIFNVSELRHVMCGCSECTKRKHCIIQEVILGSATLRCSR